MFRLDEVVQATAFFTRTDAPAFDPLGDGWWRQNYNARPLLRLAWKPTIASLLPARVRQYLSLTRRKFEARAGTAPLHILLPQRGAAVGEAGAVEGTAELPAESKRWENLLQSNCRALHSFSDKRIKP